MWQMEERGTGTHVSTELQLPFTGLVINHTDIAGEVQDAVTRKRVHSIGRSTDAKHPGQGERVSHAGVLQRSSRSIRSRQCSYARKPQPVFLRPTSFYHALDLILVSSRLLCTR